MNYKLRLYVFVMLSGFLFGCKQGNGFSEQNQKAELPFPEVASALQDTMALTNAFEMLKNNAQFKKSIGLESEEQYQWFHDNSRLLFGDLNGDGILDGVVFFSIEGRGGGNNSDAHYAVFLRKNQEWLYADQLDAGSDLPGYIAGFSAIENGILIGAMEPTHDKSLPEIPVMYILKNGRLLNIYTALHKGEDVEQEFISVYEFLTKDNQSVPITALMKEYEKVLGVGTIETPEEVPECGTYFDEGTIRYSHYPFWDFELNKNNSAAWLRTIMPGSGIRLQTDKGSVTEKTTLSDLKNLFYRKDSYKIDNDPTNGTQTLMIAVGREAPSDAQLHFEFDKNGILKSISLFIPC